MRPSPSGGSAFCFLVFPDPHGEVVTNNMLDIDAPLKAIFTLRVQEMGATSQSAPLARIA